MIAVFVAISVLVAAVAFFCSGDSESKVEDRLALLTGAKIGQAAKDALLKESGAVAAARCNAGAWSKSFWRGFGTSACGSNKPM